MLLLEHGASSPEVDVEPSLSQPARYPATRAACTALGYGLLYAALRTALNRFAFQNGWTILWPLNGLTIALLIMRPRAQWPVLLFGIEVGTGLGHWLDHNPLSTVLWYRALSLTEVLISASLLPAFSSLADWLRRPHIYHRFFASVLLGPGVSGLLTALIFHHLQGRPYLVTFNDWATADALGIAATMPLILSFRSPELRGLVSPSALPRTLGILAFALLCATLSLAVSTYPLLFLLYPVLLLVDVLLSFAGAALAICMVCFLAVWLAIHDYGPFGRWPSGLLLSRDAGLQIYLGFHILALFPASLRILERKRLDEELRDVNVQLTMLASIDGLTGVANRRALDERFVQEWNRAQRTHESLGLLMIDIDHFKQFNDLYGHPAGDRTLVTVASALAQQMRRAEDMVARFGGEEFAVLLPHTDLNAAAYLAERLRASIEEIAIAHQASRWGHVTVSIGCAVFTPSAEHSAQDHLQLLAAADHALYQAKEAGRNRVQANLHTRDLVC